ncbi:asparaginase [Myxococcota bacterium]|nr:asparaginase [Myxococcota bacterium]
MKRILFLHTGGTLGMTGTLPAPMQTDGLASKLHSFIPELETIADIDFQMVCNQDSSDLQPEQMLNFARRISESWYDYDAFLIVHGTDTMAYSAAALSFLLGPINKPVIFTGSQRPIAKIRSDAKVNLVTACQIAVADRLVPEVTIFFGQQLLRGSRASKVRTVHLDAFESPNFPPLAKVGIDIEYSSRIREATGRPREPGALAEDIAVLRLTPGLSAKLATGLIEAGASGIVLEAYGVGNVPTQARSLEHFFEAAQAKDVPVVLTSQCAYGGVRPELYQGGRLAMENGAISAGDMIVEAAVMKLSVLLGRGSSRNDIGEAFKENWVGEITL